MAEELAPPGPLAPGGLRVTALGGIGEIGRNMTVFEHLGRLLIIDCGVLFPKHDEPGVDLILPDIRHVENRLDEIEAVVITHAHEDHIGAIPHLLKLRRDIPIVGSKFTLALIAEKCREHRIKPVFVEVAEGQRTTHGVFECQYFAVNHSIPGCLAIAMHTGAGTVLHTGDIKLDQMPLDGRPTDLPGMSRLGDAGVDLFLCDSTNSEIPGVGPSESEIGPNLHRLIRGAEGRVIVACFASNVDRVQQIIDASVALGPQGVVRRPVDGAQHGHRPGARVPDASSDDDVIDIGAAEMLAADRVVLVTTGTQGEPMAALSRMSRGEHRSITLTSGDLIIMSSSQIPGNEEAIFGVIDCAGQDRRPRRHECPSARACYGPCLRRRADVPLQRGAAAQRDAGARHLAACCGPTPSWRCAAGCRRRTSCWPRTASASTWSAAWRRLRARCRSGKMFVDGLITGDVGDAVVGERLTLSSGFIAVTVVVRRGTGKPAAPPHLHSRGFSEDPKALEPAARKVAGSAGNPCRGKGHRCRPHRPGGAARRRQVGGRGVPASADDRADGARDRLSHGQAAPRPPSTRSGTRPACVRWAGCRCPGSSRVRPARSAASHIGQDLVQLFGDEARTSTPGWRCRNRR